MDQSIPSPARSSLHARILDEILARQVFLEQQNIELRKDMESLRNSNQELRNRIDKSLWLLDALEITLHILAAPLRKSVEIAIGGLILYILMHIHIKP
jgi:hypothetical protein